MPKDSLAFKDVELLNGPLTASLELREICAGILNGRFEVL